MKNKAQRYLSAINAIKKVRTLDKKTQDSVKDSEIDTSKLSLTETKKLYEEGKISKGQLDDVAIRLFEEEKKAHDGLDDDGLDELIAEEYEAIADYAAALAVCECEHAKDTLRHILEEEKEHVKELEVLKEYRSQMTKDSAKYVVYNEVQKLYVSNSLGLVGDIDKAKHFDKEEDAKNFAEKLAEDCKKKGIFAKYKIEQHNIAEA